MIKKGYKMKNKRKLKVLFVHACDALSEVENRYPPLWPAYLAAHARKHLPDGNLDFRFCRSSEPEVLQRYKPDIVGISSVTQHYNQAVEYARLAARSGCTVIQGGIHITSIPSSLSDDMSVGCIGEGEETFTELLAAWLENGFFSPGRLSGIDGIVYRDNGLLVQTSDRRPLESLDDEPFPDRTLTGYGYRGYLYTARGCQYRCVFCICARYWGIIRYSSAGRVVNEIAHLIENGVKVIRFADENFIGNRKRLREIHDLVRARELHKKVKFSCWGRANNIDQEVVDLLSGMNVVSIKMGLESGSQKILDYLKGNVTIADNERAVILLKDAGIQVNGDFIIGTPEETEEDILKTYHFIKRMPLDFIDVNIFTAYPGTPVWEDALRSGIVHDNMDWSLINIKLHENSDRCIILSRKVAAGKIWKYYRQLRRLRFWKMVRALPWSPWRNELPGVAWKRLREKTGRLFRKSSAGLFTCEIQSAEADLFIEKKSKEIS
jgi:anaerobic magnesium-protoporphyrin IX monomethyl ester cyclase